MATILLSAAGAAIGGSVGGTVAGLSSVALGRAAGASLGRVIDQRLLGTGAEAVETGKIDRFRLTNSGEGVPLTQVFGRMRVGGQVIWASDFSESTTTTGGGGKGSRPQPKTTTYSYSVSLAVALCEGEIAGVRRIWADGEEVSADDLNMHVYHGTGDQLPDPVIEAVEGEGMAPAYRGTAYVVFEDLQLDQFGNRVPQFSFEVVRVEQAGQPDYETRLADAVRGVALMPGTGEYALATSQVNYTNGPGSLWAANVNSPSGKSDFLTSMEALRDELPACDSVSLVVSWFGGDLRCGSCELRPKIEKRNIDGSNMPWQVSGLTKATADEIARIEDRPIYGGTPADASVVEAIRHMNESGQRVMFYPFILMDQLQENGLQDPWTGAEHQPHLPWRGRITLSVAPGQEGSPDQTSVADDEVAAFFGTASAGDFVVGDGVVTYTGPEEWSLRRFILHYAALCKAAGGVAAFCIGSEMRGLTQIRGALGFPAVQAFRDLAAEVRLILGEETKLGYAADWSEYFGYQPADGSGDRYFHLDPLWADDEIDFIGIDNYMLVSDWRDGDDHLDRLAGTKNIYEIDYLRANIEGGEGYDWYYHSAEAEAAQIRTQITDDAHGEPWVWRYKDMRNWWLNEHHERIGGVRQAVPTDWAPQSKPFWFTELGCAAIDKGGNQPNKFLDPKSSESILPKYSNGARDDLMQHQYLQAMLGYWTDPANNPISAEYDGQMIDMDNAYVWSWDARPFPVFPNNRDLWSDGENYSVGHWLNGRSGNRTLASVVTEICTRSGVTRIDVSELWGIVRGYTISDVSDARAALQPLMLRYGFDAVERDGVLKFRQRRDAEPLSLDIECLADNTEIEGSVEYSRESDAEMSGRVRLRFVQADANHDFVSEEAVLPDDSTHSVATNEVPLALTRAEGRQTVESWLAAARVARETIRLALPLSQIALGAGDVIRLPGAERDKETLYRIDRVELGEMQLIDAVRIEPTVYQPADIPDDLPATKAFAAPVPVLPVLMDLPLLRGDEAPHAPHLAATAHPWPGTVAVYSSLSDDNYVLDEILAARAVIGITETPMAKAPAGIWDLGEALQVKLIAGDLESRPREAILNGGNLAAIGDGSTGNWELFQFETAELVGSDTYLLSNRLRGQLGSDGLMPEVWPAGSMFVLIDPRVVQLDLPSSERRIAKHFRIGPARRGYDDPSYVHLVEAFDGNGLRPYAPTHVRVETSSAGCQFNWIRRTRIDGDDWNVPEVPLGEESETYLIRIEQNGSVLRELMVAEPTWFYDSASQVADGISGAFEFRVAQVSTRYGPGLFVTLSMSGVAA